MSCVKEGSIFVRRMSVIRMGHPGFLSLVDTLPRVVFEVRHTGIKALCGERHGF